MKCNICGSEWSVNPKYSKSNNCPFCNSPLFNQQSTINSDAQMSDVIKVIIEQFGIEILLENNKFLSIFSDYAPKLKNEKKVLRIALEENIAPYFINISPEKRKSNLTVVKRKLDSIISENATYMILTSFVTAIGWDLTLIESRKTTESFYDESISNMPDISDNSISEIHQQKSLNQKDGSTYIKDEEKIIITGLEVCGYTGNNNDPTMDSACFLSDFARYVKLIVNIRQLKTPVKATLHWQIFVNETTPISKPIETVLEFKEGDAQAYHSWGWNEPGHWKPGKYKIIAYFDNNSNNCASCYFNVYPGNYYRIPKVSSVELICDYDNASNNPKDINTIFYSDLLKYLYFRFYLCNVKKNMYTYMWIRIFEPNGTLMCNVCVPVELEKGNEWCQTTWGWKEPGHWKPGVYSYQVGLCGSNVLNGTFVIR